MSSYKGQKGINRIEAFWTKVDKKESYECWNYKEYLDKDGYGRFHYENGPIGAHVLAWILTRKCEVPEGKMILHMCDNPSCCNPDHLYCGNIFDNARDREKRNPVSAFKRSSNLKLREGEIWLIRKLKVIKSKHVYTRYKFSENFVAKMFKVDQSLIHLIWNSNKWLSLEGTYA